MVDVAQTDKADAVGDEAFQVCLEAAGAAEIDDRDPLLVQVAPEAFRHRADREDVRQTLDEDCSPGLYVSCHSAS